MSWDMSASDRADEAYERAMEARKARELLAQIGQEVEAFRNETVAKIEGYLNGN
jgi:hypothetical protein